MAAKKPKFYAVRVGLVPGVYRTWEECQPLIHGFEGAVFKSFPTEEEAQAFLEGETAPEEAEEKKPKRTRKKKQDDAPYSVPPETLVAFVDGSFDVKTGRYGFGCVLLTPDGQELTENGAGDHPEAVTARNVAGELRATLVALRRAEEMGYRSVRICHDYTGIAAWYRGEWRANSFVAREYVAATEAYRGVLQVSFEKIAAHTGVKYNEMADRLAKQAIGIEE
ncbi:MAG: ribonuclease H family protein [Clostridia bacterium]|nr:ribonuclease H family protein [Clostridia bacterium]